MHTSSILLKVRHVLDSRYSNHMIANFLQYIVDSMQLYLILFSTPRHPIQPRPQKSYCQRRTSFFVTMKVLRIFISISPSWIILPASWRNLFLNADTFCRQQLESQLLLMVSCWILLYRIAGNRLVPRLVQFDYKLKIKSSWFVNSGLVHNGVATLSFVKTKYLLYQNRAPASERYPSRQQPGSRRRGQYQSLILRNRPKIYNNM